MTTTAHRVAEVVDRGADAGRSLLRMLERSPLLPRTTCSCEIPPPCWMPRELSETTSCVCCGGTAVVRFRITNRSAEPTEVTVDAIGDDSAAVQIAPTRLELAPFQRGIVTASLPLPAEGGRGDRELLLRVHGCLEHVMRWTVREGRWRCDSCHEVDVDDAPDYIHHWYDHFYCARPCGHANAPVRVG